MATHDIALTTVVFATSTQTIAALNTIGTWVEKLMKFAEACGEAREKIQDLQMNAASCETNLNLWRKRWKLNERATIQWQTELWGDQVAQINTKMIRIQTRCLQFREQFETFFQLNLSTYLEMAIANRHLVSSRRAIDAYQEALKQEISGRQIIDFVTKLDAKGTTWIKDMEERLEDLAITADNAFRDKNGETVSGHLTDTQLQTIRASTVVQLALEVRNASEELYAQSREAALRKGAPSKSTRLKMDLTGSTNWCNLGSIHSRTATSLIYHLLLQWDEEPREMYIQGPVVVDDLQNAADVFAAYEATSLLLGASIIVDDERESKIFKSRLPSEEEKLFAEPRPWEQTTLAHFFDSLDCHDIVTRLRIFPYTERIQLAFQIVESGLLLAGTAWISNVKSDSLRRSQSRDGKYNYTVDLDKERVGWRRVCQLSEHIFRIGIILAEIGCVKRITQLHYDEMLGMYKFGLYNEDEDATIATLRNHIVPNLGEEYASITFFCLQELQHMCDELRSDGGEGPNAVNIAFKKILEVYFGRVYQPLRREASKARTSVEMAAKF